MRDAAEARQVALRSAGVVQLSPEELLADLVARQAEDDQLAEAEATIRRIARAREARRRNLETAARAEAFGEVVGQRAQRSALPGPVLDLRSNPSDVPGLSFVDGLVAELEIGFGLSGMAEHLRSVLPHGRATREAVTAMLTEAGIDPATGRRWSTRSDADDREFEQCLSSGQDRRVATAH